MDYKIINNYLTGGLYCSISSIVIGHPFDTYKVLLQNSKGRDKYNILKNIFNTKSKNNIISLYRGVSIPILISIPLYSFGIFFYSETFKNTPKIKYKEFYVGGLTGFVYSWFMSPVELIKINVQAYNLSPYKVFQNNKKNMLKGIIPTMIRDVPAYSIYFGSYYNLKNFIPNFLAGGLSGVFMWLITYPLDNIKTQVQLNRKNGHYSITKSIKELHINKNFYRGMFPILIKSFCINSFVLVSFSNFANIKT